MKKTSTNPAQQRASRRVRAGAVHRLEGEPRNGGEINAPGKQPDEMQRPEKEAGNGIVIARVAQIQESQQLLVNEEKPEKAVVLVGSAVKREREIGRIPKGSQNVPGRRDQEGNQRAAKGPQALPRAERKELMRQRQVNETGAHRKHHRDQAFQQQPSPRLAARITAQNPRVRFFFVERPKKRPHRESDAEGEHHVGDQYPGKQEKPDTSGDA